MAARFPGIVDHHTYVLASDGDLMEGVSQESIGIAGHLKLNKLIVFWDDNGITIDGHRTIADNVDQVARFQSAGWNAFHIDGHDPKAILDAIHAAQKSDKPTLIACKTTIGFGLPTHAGTQKAHSDAQGPSEIAGARKTLNWPYEPFVIPDDILAAWREAGSRGAEKREAWNSAVEALDAKAARRIRTTGARRSAGGSGSGHRRLQEEAGRREAGRRDPQGGRSGAQRHRRRLA